MALGNLQLWTNRFVTVDERLLDRIATLWPQCVALLPAHPKEDDISINLVHLLSKDPIVRRICHWVEYQFEPFGTHANGHKFSKGKIDICILLDWEREQYIAYEGKRLNITYRGQRSSLATAYVKEGMMRFLTEQYAEALPVGCMLGYVLDGDISFALNALNNAIAAYCPLKLTSGPTPAAPIQNISRFSTAHRRRSGAPIELRHALLPF